MKKNRNQKIYFNKLITYYTFFETHAAYDHDSLVWCTRDIYSKHEYLEQIHFDAAGLLDDAPDYAAEKSKDYSMIEGYKVVEYKEQPILM